MVVDLNHVTYCHAVEFHGMMSAIMKFHDGDAIVYRRQYWPPYGFFTLFKCVILSSVGCFAV